MEESILITKTELNNVFRQWLDECSNEGYDVSLYPGDWPKSSADYVWEKLSIKEDK